MGVWIRPSRQTLERLVNHHAWRSRPPRNLLRCCPMHGGASSVRSMLCRKVRRSIVRQRRPERSLERALSNGLARLPIAHAHRLLWLPKLLAPANEAFRLRPEIRLSEAVDKSGACQRYPSPVLVTWAGRFWHFGPFAMFMV